MAEDEAKDPAAEGQEVSAAQAALERARLAARARGEKPGAPGRRRGHGGRRRPGGPDEGSGAGPSYRDPQPLGDVVGKLVSQRGWQDPMEVAGVVARWPEIVGQHVAEHCVIETFDEAKLVVRTDSTTWATQLRLLLPQLERRIAEEVGEGVVNEIVVLGPGGPSWRRGPRSVPGPGPRDTYG